LPTWPMQKPDLKKALLSCAIFAMAYLASLLLWTQVEPFYGLLVTHLSSGITAFLRGLRVDSVALKGGTVLATLARPMGYGNEMLIDLPVKTAAYSFNVPLSLAVAAALFPHLQKRARACLETGVMLVAIHLLFVVSSQNWEITRLLIQKGLASGGLPAALSQFLWVFTNNLVVRFEPFLVGIYLFARFGKQNWPKGVRE